MISYVKYQAYGCTLEIPEFMLHLWPDDLELDDWPSFCGAGGGIGDWLVPEHICGVCVSPGCFVHDLDFCLSATTWQAFFSANMRLYLNIRAIVYAKADRAKYSNWQIEVGCLKYFAAVMVFGWKHFKHAEWTGNPEDCPAVKEKLHRLAMASLGIKQ